MSNRSLRRFRLKTKKSGDIRQWKLGRKVLFEFLEDRRLLSATLWVDPNVDPAPPTSHSPGIYATINNALAAARNGDTIKIVAGLYAEEIDITKTVTIIGGQVRIAGESTGPSFASFSLDAN